MIKFFRRIRQNLLQENRFSKYLLYAIGEIILVVIGILIALQVNNWNEKRILRTTQNNYLRELKADIDIMNVEYKLIVDDHTQKLKAAQDVFQSLNTCELNHNQKKRFDELLLTYNSLTVLYQVRNTYEEMLSANIYSELENKKVKNFVSEFYEHRDAMQHYIDDFRQDIGVTYPTIKKHVSFEYDGNGETTVSYEISDLCNDSEFKNAIFESVRTKEYIMQMTTILSEKLEVMVQMLETEMDN
ncbi:DUF6090 family protein [Croceivirga thetidis]|uniref:Uncharacterized protein n=1 Tax=Croceivirga thetidis TaxID=2721623 RepID=A0ABX1GM09_9FLAO|nr:DUF6090 family protein [Croceivirga thetidis]NKI30931.1 hypothetical protein [Croceivirga thetidis]